MLAHTKMYSPVNVYRYRVGADLIMNEFICTEVALALLIHDFTSWTKKFNSRNI